MSYIVSTVCMQAIMNGAAILSAARLALMMSTAWPRLIRHIKGAGVPQGTGQKEIWICRSARGPSFVSIMPPRHWTSPNNSGQTPSLEAEVQPDCVDCVELCENSMCGSWSSPQESCLLSGAVDG